jgi:outer membrane protein assembly factor BamB
MKNALRISVPLLLAVAAAGGLAHWLRASAGAREQLRLPGAPGSTAPAAVEAASQAKGSLVASDGKPSQVKGAWPAFRGADLDGISREDVPLATSWPKDGPKGLWSIPVGEGYAGAAIRNGRVYVLDYDAAAQADALRCLSLDDGKEIWRYSYPVKLKRNHGMSRTVPAVSDQYVVALGPKCHVTCVDASTGQFKWGIDLVRKYGTTVPLWYAGQCPIIDGKRAIIAPCGPTGLMIAVDLATGNVEWTTPNRGRWLMTHASIAPIDVDGRRMYLYCGSRGIAGVWADDGSLAFASDAWKINTATVPTPVVLPGGRVFCSGGYNAGSVMLQLKRAGEKVEVSVLYRLKAQVFGATQQTPIYHDGFIYGVRPDGQLACLDDTGKVRWTSRGANFGLGPFMVAGGMIYAMNDRGGLTLATAGPQAYVPMATATVLKGLESWGPMAIAGGRLIVRDLTRMVCLDVAR